MNELTALRKAANRILRACAVVPNGSVSAALLGEILDDAAREAGTSLAHAELGIREQQPAGDGGRHVEVLRQLREEVPTINDWRESVEALDAAIAALTAAGRGGEECPHCAAYRLCADVANRRADRMAELAAAPQQPVGVTDAMVEAGLHAARHDSDARLPRYKVVRSILEAALSHQQAAPSVSRPEYPKGDVVGPCVCGSWPGGPCLRCEWIPAPPVEQPAASGEGLLTNPYTGKPRDMRDVESDPEGILIVEPGAPLLAATDGLTSKQAWWAGARVGLGLPADTPRPKVAEALAARRFSGQGDVERLVEAAREVYRISERKHDAWDALREALRPFQQQDTPEQEG